MLQQIEEHVRDFFSTHPIQVRKWEIGPIRAVQQDFRVVQSGPGPRTQLWTYTSVGAATLHDPSLEFCLFSEDPSDRMLELLAMTVHYHSSAPLGLGHTVPIGEPWQGASLCDHLLVSLPYPLGPEFEVCDRGNFHAHILWLLPITKAERDFKARNDQESLERLFDEAAIEYWNVRRASVV